jgi:hypothetical protein
VQDLKAITPHQKEIAAQLVKTMQTAIPWSVSDVIDFMQADSPYQTFGDVMKEKGVEGSAPQAAPSGGTALTPEEQSELEELRRKHKR